MSKTYSHAPDADDCIAKMLKAHHSDLKNVTVTGLFVFDDDADSDVTVLKHQGYPAGAVVRITPVKERALGVSDAVIVVDRAGWLSLSQPERNALIDHELTHLARQVDKETGKPRVDAVNRPKLAMRRHDHQYGWFDEVAKRHGAASAEVRQARRLLDSASGQLYFEFATPEVSNTGRRIQSAARKAARAGVQ